MRNKFIPAVLAASVGAAGAHHSAGAFDATKTVSVSGTVRAFQWTNPHVWLWVDVAGPGGSTTTWGFEAGPTNFVKRGGVRWDTFKIGDKVTVRTHPLRDGRKGGTFLGATLADGTEIANGPKGGPGPGAPPPQGGNGGGPSPPQP